MTSGPRAGERMVHQDYIARIRFSNALPPPPNPPKLLHIPNTGLASGQYTTPGFASRLAREQPLNVEADAELGMPLSLVGMPGVFDGDERSIQAPAVPPPAHPRDRPLLRPMAALGKPKAAEANVSFLRRTEYISSSTPRRPENAAPRALLAKVRRPARPAADAAADSPLAIKRKIDRAFDAAAAELADPKRVRHPAKKHLRLVDAAPLVPDLDAFPDSGAYVTVKFLANPVSGSGRYDRRLLTGLLRPIDRTATEEALYEAAVEAHERDPANHPKPPNLMNYDFYLPPTVDVADRFRRKLDVDDPQHDSDALYTHGGASHFQFDRVRAYETAHETELDQPTKYDDEIILAFRDADADADADADGPGLAALYYPVMQRSAIRPQRTKNIARIAGVAHEGDEQIIHQLDMTVKDPTDEMREAMDNYRRKPLGWVADADVDDVDAEGDVAADDVVDDDDDDEKRRSRSSEAEAKSDARMTPDDEDRDAEGEDELADADADGDEQD